jgi:hypothetical protein
MIIALDRPHSVCGESHQRYLVYLPREDTARFHSHSRAADRASGHLLPALAAAAAAVFQCLVLVAVAIAAAKYLLHALAAATAWLSLVRAAAAAAAVCLFHVLAAAAKAQCLLHALAAAAAWLFLVRATAAAAVCLFHAPAAAATAQCLLHALAAAAAAWLLLIRCHPGRRSVSVSCPRRRDPCRRFSPPTPPPDGRVFGLFSTPLMPLLQRRVTAPPPLSTRACLGPPPSYNMLAAAWPPAAGQTAASRRYCLLRRRGARSPTHTFPHSPLPSAPPHYPPSITLHPHTQLALLNFHNTLPYPPWPELYQRRLHRRRQDGAVAHLAQLLAAFPRCRDLPDSSAARWLTGQTKSPLGISIKRDVDCPPDLANSCWASLLSPPSPPPPFPSPYQLHPVPPSSLLTTPPHAPTDTPHSRHALTHTHAHARLHILPHDARRGSSYYARSGSPSSHIELRLVPTL